MGIKNYKAKSALENAKAIITGSIRIKGAKGKKRKDDIESDNEELNH